MPTALREYEGSRDRIAGPVISFVAKVRTIFDELALGGGRG